jgi:hypothetical protein
MCKRNDLKNNMGEFYCTYTFEKKKNIFFENFTKKNFSFQYMLAYLIP